MTAIDLANIVIRTLNKQQEYFRTKSSQLLNESKDLERHLRKAALEVLNPPQPGLFDDKIKEQQ